MTTPAPDLLVVLCTVPSEEVAERLGRTLVEERLAACVNVLPAVRSFYRWQGELNDDRELLCLIKTRRALFDRLRERVTALHPYEVPEILAVAAADVNASYLGWVADSTSD
jgi:periplasmic divalent cation tolerance protein